MDDYNKIPCQICNHKIKNVCYIINRINSIKLTVGTECVTHFGIEKSVDIKKLLDEMKKVKRLEKLIKIVPGIEKTLNSWNLEPTRFPLLIPNRIEKPYLDLGKKIRGIYSNYLENPELDEFLVGREIGEALQKQRSYLTEMQKYCNDNCGDKHIPTRDIINYLERIKDEVTIDLLKEDEKFTQRTLYKISSKDLLNQFVPDVRNKLKRYNIISFNLEQSKDIPYYNYKIQKNRILY